MKSNSSWRLGAVFLATAVIAVAAPKGCLFYFKNSSTMWVRDLALSAWTIFSRQ